MYKNIILSSILVLFLAYQTAFGLKCHVTQNNSTQAVTCTKNKAQNATNYLADAVFKNINKSPTKGFKCLVLQLVPINTSSIIVPLQYCVFNNTKYCNAALNDKASRFYNKGGCKLCKNDLCNGYNPADNIVENFHLIITTGVLALCAKFLNY